jgi:hypothetical protein
MELDALTCRLGEGQGRVLAPDGTVAFVLGDVEAGRSYELVPGDRVDVTQSLDVTDVAFVRAQLSLRCPPTLPAELAWEASVVVDGVARASMRVVAGRTKRTTDLAANVSKLTGMHEVGVRLQLVAL